MEFRKMRRFKQQLSEESCVEILKNEPRGVMAVAGENGYPYAFPIDFVYDGGRLYFHCAKEGHKLDAIKSCDKVSFCVMNEGFRKDGEWALNISSVIVFGRVKIMTDSGRILEKLRLLGNKYYPSAVDVEREIGRTLSRVCMLELEIDHMTGKLVNES